MATARTEQRIRADAERLADIFTAIQRSFILQLSKELSRGNVSFAQYCLLGFLGQQEHLTMSEIAQRMGHTTAAATGLVDRLEKLGHVHRTHAKEDRRKIQVQITATGLTLVTEVRDDMVTNLIRFLGYLEPGEQKTWVKIYEKLIHHCQATCPDA